MNEDYIDILMGLLEGSRPLPPPHPQHLSFPCDPELIGELAGQSQLLVEHIGIDPPFTQLEIAHLMFKLAAWCSKTGITTRKSLSREMHRLWPSLVMTLSAERKWLTSRAGVSWVKRRDRQWQAAAKKQAREAFAEPPRVGTIDRVGFYLVELTNGAHVYREGRDLGHCMWYSVNKQVLMKHGFPVSGPAALACLTYAVKIRSGEVRIFSVRDPDGNAMMTIEYSPKQAAILHMEESSLNRENDVLPTTVTWKWKKFKCDVVLALAEVVPVKICCPDIICRGPCIRRHFCLKKFAGQESRND